MTTATGRKRVVRLLSLDDPSLSIQLQSGVNRVGRQRTDNHIVLVSAQISRHHAEVVVDDNAVRVRDLGSANGTFVNGERVESRLLAAGDTVSFSEEFRLRLAIEEPRPEPGRLTLPQTSAGDLPQTRTGVSARLTVDTIPQSLEKRTEALRRSSPGLEVDGRPAGTPPTAEVPSGPEPADDTVSPAVERERQQLAVLYRVSRQCMGARSLSELDRLLMDVLEQTLRFDRGFVSYQLLNGDWKLIMSPKGDYWERSLIRELLQTSLKAAGAVVVGDSRADPQLGFPERGTDQRLLLPLRTPESPVGAIFMISTTPAALSEQTVDFLSLFADIAAQAIVSCARMDRGHI
jgi:pSer/pThr/pTyr-binding forkhead associated (FHA) protein